MGNYKSHYFWEIRSTGYILGVIFSPFPGPIVRIPPARASVWKSSTFNAIIAPFSRKTIFIPTESLPKRPSNWESSPSPLLLPFASSHTHFSRCPWSTAPPLARRLLFCGISVVKFAWILPECSWFWGSSPAITFALLFLSKSCLWEDSEDWFPQLRPALQSEAVFLHKYAYV